jgi:hypothetical protein
VGSPLSIYRLKPARCSCGCGQEAIDDEVTLALTDLAETEVVARVGDMT